ncbi:MAG: hypothetical protein A3F72_14115 [Bacteroidetes bacterium RIFCSPLOWO2_12_FULL_35_15]|nr:MAG: hypothetical protein A3F72_14115 [Bacteroidetes bacterium RIFCSPLOWO2_12_FULL_35_15]
MKTEQKKQPEQQSNRIKDFLFKLYNLIFKNDYSDQGNQEYKPQKTSDFYDGLEAYHKARKIFYSKDDKERKVSIALLLFDLAIEYGVHEASADRAFCLQEMDFHYDSIQDFDNSICRCKNDANLYFGRGNSKHCIADFEGAIEDLSLAIELSKKDNELNKLYNDAEFIKTGYKSITQLYELHLVAILQEKKISQQEFMKEYYQSKVAKIKWRTGDTALQQSSSATSNQRKEGEFSRIWREITGHEFKEDTSKVGQFAVQSWKKPSVKTEDFEENSKPEGEIIKNIEPEKLYPIVEVRNSEEWTKIDQSSVCIAWNKQPFFHKKSIIWRGIVIHTKVSDTNGDLGFKKVIVFVINNKIFRFGLGKWKYMIGSIGTAPEIKCQTHSLKIKTDFRAMTLTLSEEPLNKVDETNEIIENPFNFFDTPDNILFEEPIKITPVPVDPFRINLFEDRGNDVYLDSCAYFNEEGLTVEYGEMGRRSYYEDEYYITVKKDDLHLLYKEFKVVNEEKVELLQAILKSYNDKDCFKNFKAFLELKNIPFDNGVRHG